MQRKRTPKGLSASARRAVDDHYANPCPELSSRHPEIAERLDVLERYWVATQDLPVRKAAKVVGKGLTTIDQWVARLEEGGPANLAKHSTRPKNIRKPDKRTPEVLTRIKKLREEHPSASRDLLYDLLRKDGLDMSKTTVGRVLRQLYDSGDLAPIGHRKGRS